MQKIFIKYNPYQVKTEILIDGNVPKKNSRFNFGDRRLQEWVDDLPDILFEECSTRDFEITFHGTIPDYEDIVAMADEAKAKNINIKLEHIPAKEVKDKEAGIQEIFKMIQEGPFEELKKPDVVRTFELANSSDFEVNVVATMSAGKSTLINSLLGQRLMPAKQEACTARHGIIVCSPDQLAEEAEKKWLHALGYVSRWSEIPKERILKSVEEFNFGGDEYVLDFEIINLNYEIGCDPEHPFTGTATEKYRVSVLRSGGVWLDRYVVFDDSEEVRFECTDREPESGTKFEIDDVVKFVKDPFNDDWIVKGKIGTKRGFGMADDSNFYYIEKVGDEERHFDDAHETELTKVK